MPSQDLQGNWHALPYELAHGLARSLVLHCRKWQDLKDSYDEALAKDPTARKEKTQELANSVNECKNCRRFMVFNRRTGHMATLDFMQRHFKVVDGKPVLKKPGKAKPWVASFRFKVNRDAAMTLHMSLAEGEPDLPVRCLELSSNQARAGVRDLVDGYGHLLDGAEATCPAT